MQDTKILDTFAIEREARALRAEAARRMFTSLRGWLAGKLSGGTVAGGKTA